MTTCPTDAQRPAFKLQLRSSNATGSCVVNPYTHGKKAIFDERFQNHVTKSSTDFRPLYEGETIIYLYHRTYLLL
jgi:hypothetical protein